MTEGVATAFYLYVFTMGYAPIQLNYEFKTREDCEFQAAIEWSHYKTKHIAGYTWCFGGDPYE